MKTEKTIVSHIGEMDTDNWGWLFCTAGKGDHDNFLVQEDYKDAAKLYGVSETLIKDIETALCNVAKSIKDEVEKDLIDLFEKIEELEQ